ncbi:hypothetical protein ACU4GG_40400 [Streptomyces nojiriensis]
MALMRSAMPELPDDPAPEQAEALGGLYADAFRRADAGGLRRWLLARLRSTADPGAERYWRLPATVNGWPASAALATVHPWFTAVSAGSGAGTAAEV